MLPIEIIRVIRFRRGFKRSGAPGNVRSILRGDRRLTKPELGIGATSYVPLQLLAYHADVLRNCNVDKPRNLAKSVPIE